MIETFRINSSPAQSIFLVFLYSLTLAAAFFYIDSTLSLLLLSGLILLLTIFEGRSWLKQKAISLTLNSVADSIELEQAGKAQIYIKYKVYTCRWFAILQLIDNQKYRSLLLNSDRFMSTEAYQDFRFVIQKMDRQKIQRGRNAA